MKRALEVACAVAFPLCSAAAQQDQNMALAEAVFANMATETTICGSYFLVISHCAGNTPTTESQDTAKAYSSLANKADELALVYSRMAGIKPEALSAQADMASEKMWEQIDNNCLNAATLASEHLKICQTAMRSAESRFEYWHNRLEPRFVPQ